MRFTVHPFSLRQLQYAVAVADTLSFRAAAERCHVSQPALSTQVAHLEDLIGVRLFERDRRGVVPTPAGGVVLERARRLLQEADDLMASATRPPDPLAGTLRIGVIPTIAPYLLPRLTPKLRESFPRLVALWVEDKTAAVVRDVTEGSLDAALVAMEADLGDLEIEPLARDPFVLATRPDDPLAQAPGAAAASELAGAEVLLLDDGHCFREQALSFCSRVNARELEFRATSLSTLSQMVAGGVGVTLLPSLAIPTESERAGLAVRAFADPAPARTLALVWRKRSPLADALRRLAVVVRDAWP
jgi:LysR family hydrogen peroxide-inducible transcriptional activator